MKRFKKFLTEEMSTDKLGPEATNTTPLSSVTPPAPSMFAPDSVKQQYQNYVTQAQQGPYLAQGDSDEYDYIDRWDGDPFHIFNPRPQPPMREINPLDGSTPDYDDPEYKRWQEEWERRRKEYNFERDEWLRNLEKIYGINPNDPYWRNMFDYQWRYRQWEQGGRFGNPPQPPNFPPPDKWEGPMPRFQDYDRNGDGRLDNDEHGQYARDLDRWAQEFERQLQQG